MAVNADGFLRSMADPNVAGDPKYYKGVNWFTGSADNGGVHFNSGVQNYWFYLLVEGEQGTNEEGFNYNVPAIGWEKASKIAFRNLTVYLNESSNYLEARRGSLQAAADLYGHCSVEYLAVNEAWLTCGIGLPVEEGDFEIDYNFLPQSGCDLDTSIVDVMIFNNGCNTSLTANTTINLKYQLDEETPVEEQLTLPADFLPGNTITYEFRQPIISPSFDDHLVRAWIEIPGDPLIANDTIEHTIVNRPVQNEEFSTEDRFAPVEGVCSAILGRTVRPSIRYDGCDTFPESTFIPYNVRFKDQIINGRYRSTRPIAPLGTAIVEETIIMRDFGFGDAVFEIFYPGDPTLDNNQARIFAGRLDQIKRGTWTENFDDFALDSTFMAIEKGFSTDNDIQVVDSDHKLIVTGGDVLDKDGKHTRKE